MADTLPIREILKPGQSDQSGQNAARREWLVTNGLGGYASGTVTGEPTRRYHGLLVSALPAPLGRVLAVGPLFDGLALPNGKSASLGHFSLPDLQKAKPADLLAFRLEFGLPIWTYQIEATRIERRVVMPHHMNSVVVVYRLLQSPEPVTLELTPTFPARSYDDPVNTPPADPFVVHPSAGGWEIRTEQEWPPVCLSMGGVTATLGSTGRVFRDVRFAEEDERGYAAIGDLAAPATFRFSVRPGQTAYFRLSTEDCGRIDAVPVETVESTEQERRRRLLASAGAVADDPLVAELVLAADQFLIEPVGRPEQSARIRAEGDEPRSVIAGYPWFTDWGRDTMISLEGLTLATGRAIEAGCILRTFAHSIRDGLMPNYFPDGKSEGVYHTADASLWFFHALHRYVTVSGDQSTLRVLLPSLSEIIASHICGTRFGIQIDPTDGLLRQGDHRFPLTWMDARMGDWVVTPRRGKAVEINALWYNALCLFRQWSEGSVRPADSDLTALIEQVRSSFNQRFWNREVNYLYDVVDGEQGDDPACRPNQVLAIALEHAVLERGHWLPVLHTVRDQLLTAYGLRTLTPGHANYKGYYRGDLRARDGAYHQGAVWPWLLGPWIDGWLKAHPEDRLQARLWLEGLIPHLNEACVGSVSEIFDAEPPHLPRGCFAQAWSVAELLRCWIKTAPAAPHPSAGPLT